jgi:hypothetical protein
VPLFESGFGNYKTNIVSGFQMTNPTELTQTMALSLISKIKIVGPDNKRICFERLENRIDNVLPLSDGKRLEALL